jgi:hypothetical protein
MFFLSSKLCFSMVKIPLRVFDHRKTACPSGVNSPEAHWKAMNIF